MDVPPIQYVRASDGFDIAYATCGRGIPLVRVPSLFGHFAAQWKRAVLDKEFQAFSKHFRFILFDCRGQGSSSRGLSDATSVDDYVSDLELLVDHLGLDRFLLQGTTAMSKIATSYAVKHPARVRTLLLLQYADYYRGTRIGLQQLASSDWPLFIQSAARMGWPWADSSVVTEVLREAITQGDFLRQFQAISREPGDPLLERLPVPTLVMATRENFRPLANEAEARRIAALIPEARLVLFDDVYGGYAAQEQGPPPAVAAIQRFLEELPDAGRGPVNLSSRQLDVMRLVAAGKTNQEIADALVISMNTVRRHVSDIFDKTGAANRTEAAAYARDQGLA